MRRSCTGKLRACVRRARLDADRPRSKQFLYDHVRKGPSARPFCMTVSLTHPHDPYTIEKKYWDMYEDVDIGLPKVTMAKEEQDPHSKRLLKVCDLWDENFTPDQIKRARRAYYGAVSYVDDCIGKLIQTLKECNLDEETIIVFSGDHGDMLGERGLWYKMSYFEASVRVPMLIHHPATFKPHHVSANVSTLDILPTLVDLAGTKLWEGLPMDGTSVLPYLENRAGGSDTVYAEYCGEGTIAPMMMIKRGSWKYITCPADPDQLYDLSFDPQELVNLAELPSKHPLLTTEVATILANFKEEALNKWDMPAIIASVLTSQRSRRLVWSALKTGKFTSWDYNPQDDGREKYIRSHIPLDDLELKARFPPVDEYGRSMKRVAVDLAGSHGQ
jgi:choline-sulfatase